MPSIIQVSNFLCKNPWLVLHAGCTLAFLVQMVTLTRSLLNPSQTISHTSIENVTVEDFPVIFKVCIKPGFDDEALQEAGYESTFEYFLGKSRYNQSLYGWAGHTEEGGVVTNVEGEIILLHREQSQLKLKGALGGSFWVHVSTLLVHGFL